MIGILWPTLGALKGSLRNQTTARGGHLVGGDTGHGVTRTLALSTQLILLAHDGDSLLCWHNPSIMYSTMHSPKVQSGGALAVVAGVASTSCAAASVECRILPIDI